MQYYGTRLSENISRRDPEGYLLCLNVPVARTGMQEYLPGELDLPPGVLPPGPDRLVAVWRPAEEVFAPETLASFEGMPVTNDHPPDGVDIRNIQYLQMGHAHNVRRGTGEEADLLLADLIITDPRLIDAVLGGKREISCGYTYELHAENGQYIQRKIRGNHIAVVEAGRAGKRVSIRDHKGESANPKAPPESSPRVFIKDHQANERSKKTMTKPLTRLLARVAKDGDLETVAEYIEEILSAEPAGSEAAPAPAAEAPAEETVPPVTVEVPENREITVDEGSLAGIQDRLDQLLRLLTAVLGPGLPAADDDPAGEAAEAVEEVVEAVLAEPAAPEMPEPPREEAAAAAEEVAGLVESIVAPVLSTASTTLEETEGDTCGPDPLETRDTLRAVLRAVRPALAKMPPRQRRQVSADIAANLRAGGKGSRRNPYAALAGDRRSSPQNPADLGRRIMASRNPNYQQ